MEEDGPQARYTYIFGFIVILDYDSRVDCEGSDRAGFTIADAVTGALRTADDRKYRRARLLLIAPLIFL